MGIIMRNNIAYSGGGGSETVELSMAEYEAREAAGAIDSDTWYLIYDATDSYNAKKVVYDNAESGMTARTVQGAIDELNSKIGGESMNELFYGSMAEREALADAITSKGVETSTADSLNTMAEKVSSIDVLEYVKGSKSATVTKNSYITQTIEFGKTFITKPIVYVYNTSNLRCTVTAITNSNATLHWQSADGYQITSNYQWIAVAFE